MAVREKQAARWVAVQRRRRRIPVAGVAQLRDTGRPAVVYGTCRKVRQLEHELRVTDVALIYDGVPMERDVRVGATTADGLLTGDGWRAYVEVDNSAKMTRRQYEAKWRCYEGVTDFVLVVAVAEARMERIRSWSEAVQGIALFSTFDRLRSGVAEPWVGFDGRTAAL